MILVIGGLGSGKRDYVQKVLGYPVSAIADAVLDSRPVLDNLQDLVATDAEHAMSLLPDLTGKAVIICREVGCGVVPVDRQERAWREAVGRLCIALASQSDRVIRMTCGLPQILKG